MQSRQGCRCAREFTTLLPSVSSPELITMSLADFKTSGRSDGWWKKYDARHVARLRRWGGGGVNFKGAIVTGRRTQLTSAIMGGATVLRVRVQNNAASSKQAAEFFFLVLYTPLRHSEGTCRRKWNQQNCQINLLGARRQLRQMTLCPFLATYLCDAGSKAGDRRREFPRN